MHAVTARAAVCLLLLLLLTAPARAQESCAARLATDLGAVHQIGDMRLSALQNSQNERNLGGGMRYRRFLFQRTGTARGDWRLAIRDEKLRVLQWLGPDELTLSSAVWTNRFAAAEPALGPGKIRFTLHGVADGDDLSITLREVFVMPDHVENTFYSRQDQNRSAWEDLYTSSGDLRQAGDAIGILITHGLAGRASACTGVAVGENLFLTNWHCGQVASGEQLIPQLTWDHEEVCKSTLVDFSWDDDPRSNDFRCHGVAAQSEALDYALLDIRPLVGQPSVLPLAIATDRLGLLDTIQLIHHPEARIKSRSTNCSLRALDVPGWRTPGTNTEFAHICDTEGGSSGAPILDESYRVRGLHHLGFESQPGTCEPIPGGTNKAVWIDAIVNDLRRNGFELDAGGILQCPEGNLCSR